jgi:hypothetical protein
VAGKEGEETKKKESRQGKNEAHRIAAAAAAAVVLVPCSLPNWSGVDVVVPAASYVLDGGVFDRHEARSGSCL